MSSVPNKKPVGRPKKRSMAGTAAMSNPGRPPKTDLSDVSYSTISRRARDIAQTFDLQIIQLALNIAKKNANCDDEKTENSISSAIPHTPESGFALFLENDFTKAQWERLCEDSKKRGFDNYPSFYKLAQVKAQCRPTVYSIENEVCVQVSFQEMLDKTAERLVNVVGTDWASNDLEELTLICAYGFDSSSGFSNPHQKFDDPQNVTLKSELSLFATTFTISGLVNRKKESLWLNPTPQSVRFCRPLRIAVEKETNDTITITAEKERLEYEIEELLPHSFTLPNGKKVEVNFDAYLSMVDGKCLNVILENNATVRCPVCHLSMNNFNEEQDWNSVVPTSNLKHGIGNLHCTIKALELLIKLACRQALPLPLQWTVQKKNKHIIKTEMGKIKTSLFETFAVRIEEVQHGSGTSLNGNSARTCFKDTSTLAEILGINKEFVKRLWFCLLAFRQKQGVNLSQLEVYCTETYKLFFKLYPWAKMNPSVHKLLRHGVPIAKQFPLSLAFFAEDAAESMHKSYKKNSKCHARQSSRANRLKDVFNRSIDLSDPVISMIYLDDRCKGAKNDLPDEFITLFMATDN